MAHSSADSTQTVHVRLELQEPLAPDAAPDDVRINRCQRNSTNDQLRYTQSFTYRLSDNLPALWFEILMLNLCLMLYFRQQGASNCCCPCLWQQFGETVFSSFYGASVHKVVFFSSFAMKNQQSGRATVVFTFMYMYK